MTVIIYFWKCNNICFVAWDMICFYKCFIFTSKEYIFYLYSVESSVYICPGYFTFRLVLMPYYFTGPLSNFLIYCLDTNIELSMTAALFLPSIMLIFFFIHLWTLVLGTKMCIFLTFWAIYQHMSFLTLVTFFFHELYFVYHQYVHIDLSLSYYLCVKSFSIQYICFIKCIVHYL